MPLAYHRDTQDLAQLQQAMVAHDTRRSTSHPLRHAVLNVIRAVADYRASSSNTAEALSLDISTDPIPTPPIPEVSTSEPTTAAQNGSHYLLTSLTLFTSHEPCIMCSMALLHSRVKEIFYLIPMERTGGCGLSVCVPKLNGINHRFGVGIWSEGKGGISSKGLEIDESTDA